MIYLTSNRLSVKNVGIGLLALLFIVAIYFSLSKNTNDTSPERNIAASTIDSLRAERVFINNSHEFTNHISPKDWYDIERRLYINTVNVSGNPPDLYTGVVRQDSLSRIMLPTSYSVKVLVDILPARLTYEVLVVESKNTATKTRSIFARCASDELQIENNSACRQGAA